MAIKPAPKPIEPLRVTPDPTSKAHPIERWLAALLRIIAVIFLARSIVSWFIVTGSIAVPDVGSGLFEPPFTFLSIIIVTSLASVIAATGLWLLAPWGAVLWLSLVATDAVLYVFLPDFALAGPTIVLMNCGLIAIYLGLIFQVQRNAAAK
ncbi:MAG: hypothetical protein AAF590_01075 [Pseudomonadota bacterium]